MIKSNGPTTVQYSISTVYVRQKKLGTCEDGHFETLMCPFNRSSPIMLQKELSSVLTRSMSSSFLCTRLSDSALSLILCAHIEMTSLSLLYCTSMVKNLVFNLQCLKRMQMINFRDHAARPRHASLPVYRPPLIHIITVKENHW